MSSPSIRALASLALLASAACDGGPLRWEPATLADGAAALPAGAASVGALWLPHVDGPGTACVQSLRTVMLGDSAMIATWWSVRPDSSATLVARRGAMRRDADGGTRVAWEGVLPVDTLDRGAFGCARPAPAIAFEPRTGYVHISYAMHAPEGTGVFFAHSMDAGRMYHSPVSIIYGPRLAQTAIAARGDTVAIAYLDPNTAEPQVALALSVTAGHIFEEKSIAITSGAWPASAPAVAMDADGVLIEWREGQPGRAVPMRRRGAWAR